MRSIDIHAHVTPQSYIKAMKEGQVWHGVGPGPLDIEPQLEWTPEQRIKDMDSLGVDVQVASTGAQFYYYGGDAQVIAAMHRECNDEVYQMTIDHPDRFKGLAQIPMQNVDLAIAELDRCVNQLGMAGAMIDDKVNGKTFDEPEFLPLWKAAEQMGAVFLIHQGGGTLVAPRTRSYHLPNTIGNLVDRAVTFASFVMGGVMDACPDLKICLAHGGGYACYGVGRMDRSWDVGRLPQIPQPPSAYLSRFYYDCLTHSESALRMLIDMAGIDKVVFGTDWPFDMQIDWPVAWVLSLESLTQDEKEAILWKNMEKLLGMSSD
ncbi:MAG: amidohydrolase family protein [Chloroflexota bacterium]|nr:amidohydrolase family protein [Chloroflexota bacterium]